MALSPITSATISNLAAPAGSSWAGRLISYPFSASFLKKIAIIVVFILAAGIALTAIDMLMQTNYDDHDPTQDPISPQGPRDTPPSGPGREKPKITPPPPPSETLPQRDLEDNIGELLKTPEPRGLPNGGNGCFLNSMLQIIIHSGIYRYFLNPDNRIPEKDPGFYRYLAWFVEQYHQSEGITNQHFRSFLGFEPGSQECPGEALDRLMKCFNTRGLETVFEKRIVVTGTKTEVKGSPEEYKELKNDRYDAGSDSHVVLQLPAPKRNGEDLSAIFFTFCNSKQEARIKFACEGKVYTADRFEEKLTSADGGLKDHLFIALKRALPNGGKNTNTLNGVKECQLGDDTFELKAFAVHLGTASGSGHYVAYCYLPDKDKWYEFNDTGVTVIESSETVYEHAKSASLLYFTKSGAVSDGSLSDTPDRVSSGRSSESDGMGSDSGGISPPESSSDEE